MADEPTPDQPEDAQHPGDDRPDQREDLPVAGRFADPKVQQELDANEANQRQPLRGRPVENDVEPVATFEVDVEPTTGQRSRITKRSHAPGKELPPKEDAPQPAHFEERDEAAESTAEAIDAARTEAALERAAGLSPVPVSPVSTDADASYDSRDNIVRE